MDEITKNDLSKVYVPVLTLFQKPEVDEPVIGIWKEFPDTVRVVYMGENGYWWLAEDCADCDAPDYWLWEIEYRKLTSEAVLKLTEFFSTPVLMDLTPEELQYDKRKEEMKYENHTSNITPANGCIKS